MVLRKGLECGLEVLELGFEVGELLCGLDCGDLRVLRLEGLVLDKRG